MKTVSYSFSIPAHNPLWKENGEPCHANGYTEAAAYGRRYEIEKDEFAPLALPEAAVRAAFNDSSWDDAEKFDTLAVVLGGLTPEQQCKVMRFLALRIARHFEKLERE